MSDAPELGVGLLLHLRNRVRVPDVARDGEDPDAEALERLHHRAKIGRLAVLGRRVQCAVVKHHVRAAIRQPLGHEPSEAAAGKELPVS